MRLYLKKNYQMVLIGAFIVLMIGSTALLAYTIYEQKQIYPIGALPLQAEKKIIYALFICYFSLLGSSIWLVNRRINRIASAQNWLIDAVNWNIERLKAHGLCMLPEIEGNTEGTVEPSRWPWGNHHTETLGHLEAAARRFWTLYDPDDVGTAPTNDMVATWLHSERGISKEKARAIASMLRPDGLPTGPRK